MYYSCDNTCCTLYTSCTQTLTLFLSSWSIRAYTSWFSDLLYWTLTGLFCRCRLSCAWHHQTEWCLHPQVVGWIWLHFDVFGTEENTNCPQWFLMHGPPGPVGTDALSFSWPQVKLYFFLASSSLGGWKYCVPRRSWWHQNQSKQRQWIAEFQELLKGCPLHWHCLWCVPLEDVCNAAAFTSSFSLWSLVLRVAAVA